MTTDTNTYPTHFLATMRHDKLGVTNSFGEFVEISPIPPGYCIHGKYVGGCGIDWICGACEFGYDDGDGTEAHFDGMAEVLANQLQNKLRLGMLAISLGPEGFPFIRHCSDNVRDQFARMARHHRERNLRNKLALGPDDSQWWTRAQDLVDTLARKLDWFDEDGPRQYTEIDEIHEYGFVPEGGEI